MVRMHTEQNHPLYNTKTAEKERNSDRALLNLQKNIKNIYAHNKTNTNSFLHEEPQKYMTYANDLTNLEVIADEIADQLPEHGKFDRELAKQFLTMAGKLLNCKYISLEVRNLVSAPQYFTQSEAIQSKNIEKLVQRTIKKTFESHETETCRNNKEPAMAIGSYIDLDNSPYKICIVYVFTSSTIPDSFALRSFIEMKIRFFLKLFTQTSTWNSQDHYIKMIIESIPEGVIIRNTDGKVVSFNNVALNMTRNYPDLSNNSITVDPFWDSYDLDNNPIPTDKTPSIRALETRKEIHGEIIQILPHNGDSNHKIKIYASAAPMFDQQHHIIGSIVIFQNLSSVLQTAETMKTMFESYFHKLANISQVLISEPVIIKKEVFALIDQYISQNAQKVASINKHFNTQERKILEFIEIIDELTQLELHQFSESTYYCSLAVMLHNFIQKQKSANPDRQIIFHSNAGDSQINGLWNSKIIHSILENLIGNAIKYSNDNIEVFLEKQRDNTNNTDLAVISVKDYGYEIPIEDREKIFEPRHRGNGAKTTKFGLGLGLSICKNFIQSLNGNIIYDRLDNKNVFIVTLPIQRVQ